MSERTPILFLSDDPSATSGLARITRDLATRLHEHCSDVFEVATVGYGGAGSKKLPFPTYHLHSIDKWLVPELPGVWEDFVGDREGILMCVWDLSRLYWLGKAEWCPIPHLRQWLETAKVKKWAYHAIDAEGPNGKLCHNVAETYKGFDRLIDYSHFSCRVTGNNTWLPHGIDSHVFYPRDRKLAKKAFREGGFLGLNDNSLLVGIVATNQARKDWALGIQTVKMLLDKGHDVRLWAHTDVIERHWNIASLVMDFGLVGRAAVTINRFSDEQLAWMTSACDVTLGIGSEGFGFPLAESLACGTPVVTGNYAAQTEFVPKRMLVEPVAFRYEGPFCSRRPVYDPRHWAAKAEKLIGDKCGLPHSIDWNEAELWPAWERWFRAGVE